MLVVDSTAWIDYFNGVENPRTNYLESILTTTPILIGDLMLAEILQGFRQDDERIQDILLAIQETHS